MSHFLVLLLGIVVSALCMYLVLQNKRKRLTERESTHITFANLEDENATLKRDLTNIVVYIRKLEIDRNLDRTRQDELDSQVEKLGRKFLSDSVKWIGNSLTPNNYAKSKRGLLKSLEWCRGVGLAISTEEENAFLADLKNEYERVVRNAVEREEQARIKAQIREEQKLQRETEEQLKRIERERKAIEIALQKALAEAKDEHSMEVESLRKRLVEAEEQSQRAVSRAQMTKSGHVYVISNIGSFGEGIYKIGMTRRLEPYDRVKELGDASVPFPFDVHMMVSSDDAPCLENELHKRFHLHRVNKANPRKEFFKANIEEIHDVVVAEHGDVKYMVDAEALEYRQSTEISDEDVEFIEKTYQNAPQNKET